MDVKNVRMRTTGAVAAYAAQNKKASGLSCAGTGHEPNLMKKLLIGARCQKLPG